jgi:hypothetical protein
MTTTDQIKSLLKSGDVAGAEALCRKALEATPDDAQLKMLFGTCRQLQGDEATFRRIHDELAPEMEKTSSAETLSLWRKYHKLWMALIVGALVIGGAAAGVVVFREQINVIIEALSSVPNKVLYAGPEYIGPEYEDRIHRSEYEDLAIHGGE